MRVGIIRLIYFILSVSEESIIELGGKCRLQGDCSITCYEILHFVQDDTNVKNLIMQSSLIKNINIIVIIIIYNQSISCKGN